MKNLNTGLFPPYQNKKKDSRKRNVRNPNTRYCGRGRYRQGIWPSHTAALLCPQGIFYSGLVRSQEICTANHWSSFIKGRGIFLAHIKGTWIPFLQKHPNGFNRSSDLSPFDIWLHSEWKKQSQSWETGHFPSGHKTPFLDHAVYLNREYWWWKKCLFYKFRVAHLGIHRELRWSDTPHSHSQPFCSPLATNSLFIRSFAPLKNTYSVDRWWLEDACASRKSLCNSDGHRRKGESIFPCLHNSYT